MSNKIPNFDLDRELSSVQMLEKQIERIKKTIALKQMLIGEYIERMATENRPFCNERRQSNIYKFRKKQP